MKVAAIVINDGFERFVVVVVFFFHASSSC